MSLLYLAVGLVALQRLAELALSARNTRRLLEVGAYEVGAGHYPWLVLLHMAWLASLVFAVPADTQANRWLLGLYLGLQAARIWVIASLGPYWTTRIIVVPDRPLVTSGPYRYLRHPNYAIVVAEIALLPLAFGAWEIAFLFTLFNLFLLYHRLRIEERALAPRRAPGSLGNVRESC